jgi:hypothetical protein
MLDIPNKHDLKKITLPNIEIKFNTRDKEIIQYIKEAEGSIEIQKNIKRKLLDGSSGSTFKKGRFYPYKDSRGNLRFGGRRDVDGEADDFAGGWLRVGGEWRSGVVVGVGCVGVGIVVVVGVVIVAFGFSWLARRLFHFGRRVIFFFIQHRLFNDAIGPLA